MEFQNKWNKRVYTLIERTEAGQIILQREDGSRFTIQSSEFKFNYVLVKT